jgi:hypothetical protein
LTEINLINVRYLEVLFSKMNNETSGGSSTPNHKIKGSNSATRIGGEKNGGKKERKTA